MLGEEERGYSRKQASVPLECCCVFLLLVHIKFYYDLDNVSLTVRFSPSGASMLHVAQWEVCLNFPFMPKLRAIWKVLVGFVFGLLFHLFEGNPKGGTQRKNKAGAIRHAVKCYDLNGKHLQSFATCERGEKCFFHLSIHWKNVSDHKQRWKLQTW